MRLMKEHRRSVEKKPGDKHVNDDRNPDGLTQTRPCPLVLVFLNKRKKLMGLEFFVAVTLSF